MALTFTTNLALKLTSEMTDEIVFNFKKLDELGSLFQVDSADTASLRSKANVVIEANSAALGGSGSGGTITLGNEGNALDVFQVHAATVNYSDAILSDAIIDAGSNQISNIGDSEISATAGIAYGKLNLVGSILDTDLDPSFSLPWTQLNKTGSSLADLATKNHSDLTGAGTNSHAQIDTHLASSSGVHGVSGSVVGTSGAQTLSGKTIDASANTITNLTNSSVATAAAIQGTKISPNFGSQEVLTQDKVSFQKTFKTSLRPAQTGQVANLTFTLPSNAGGFGQVLTSNGSGTLSWSTVSGGGSSSQTFTWASADPNTKTFNHNFNTRNVRVTVIDENFKTIEVDGETRTTVNDVELTRTGTALGDWTVILTAH